MAYNYEPRPADWIPHLNAVRNNVYTDDDVVGGNIAIIVDWPNGPIHDDGARATDASIGSTSPYPRSRGGSIWSNLLAGGFKYHTGGYIVGTSSPNNSFLLASLPADFDITIDATIGTRVGVVVRVTNQNQLLRCFLDAVTGRVVVERVFGGGVTATPFTGSTVIAGGERHTLRVVLSGTSWSIYLDGVLEGSPTITDDAATTEGGIYSSETTSRIHDVQVAGIEAFPPDTTYEVVNIDGDSVIAAAVAADTIYLLDADLVQRGGIGPYGWYHLRYSGADRADGDRGFGASYGDFYFGRVADRPGFPAPPALDEAASGYSEFDEVAHGYLGMGPVRYARSSASVGTTAAGLAIADDWWVAQADGVRPRRNVVTYPFGDTQWVDQASLEAEVAAYAGSPIVWDAYNEPGTLSDYTLHVPAKAQEFYDEQLEPFHTIVTGVDPDAIVLMPSIVKVFEGSGGGNFDWIAELDAVGAFDLPNVELSIHAYNLAQHNLGRTRRILDDFFAALTAIGQQNIPIWQTEQGGLSEWNGIFQPAAATQDVALQVFMQELYGIIHERNVCWYDLSHGFDDFSAWQFGHDQNQVLPTPLMLRTLDAELRGTVLDERFDFGSAADAYAGGRFTRASDSTATVGLIAQSAELPPVLLRVTGASSLTVVDTWGNESTVTVTGGVALVQCPYLTPVWVRVPSGVTVDVDTSDYTWSTDYCLTSSGGSVSTSGGTFNGTTSKVIDGEHYSNGGYFDLPPYEKSTAGNFPHYWTVDLGTSRDINTVVVKLVGATDVEIQTSPDGSTWTTREHYQRTNPIERWVGVGRCFYARYENTADMIAWQQTDTITATHVRLKVNGATWNEVYIPAFETEAQANETYQADTSTYPMGYMTQVEKISAFEAGAPRRTVLLLAAS